MDFDSRKIIPDLIQFFKIMLPLSLRFISFCTYSIIDLNRLMIFWKYPYFRENEMSGKLICQPVNFPQGG